MQWIRRRFRRLSETFFPEGPAGSDGPLPARGWFQFTREDRVRFWLIVYVQVIFLSAISALSLRYLDEFGITLITGAIFVSLVLDLCIFRFVRDERKVYLGPHQGKDSGVHRVFTPRGFVNG